MMNRYFAFDFDSATFLLRTITYCVESMNHTSDEDVTLESEYSFESFLEASEYLVDAFNVVQLFLDEQSAGVNNKTRRKGTKPANRTFDDYFLIQVFEFSSTYATVLTRFYHAINAVSNGPQKVQEHWLPNAHAVLTSIVNDFIFLYLVFYPYSENEQLPEECWSVIGVVNQEHRDHIVKSESALKLREFGNTELFYRGPFPRSNQSNGANSDELMKSTYPCIAKAIKQCEDANYMVRLAEIERSKLWFKNFEISSPDSITGLPINILHPPYEPQMISIKQLVQFSKERRNGRSDQYFRRRLEDVQEQKAGKCYVYEYSEIRPILMEKVPFINWPKRFPFPP
ncbi:MAG: hypothetical protein R3C11_27120 [Planctomycetaceae bacterium]